jgi:hypothetical protein
MPTADKNERRREVIRAKLRKKWSSHLGCLTCGAGEGEPCRHVRSGVVLFNAHPGRPRRKL